MAIMINSAGPRPKKDESCDVVWLLVLGCDDDGELMLMGEGDVTTINPEDDGFLWMCGRRDARVIDGVGKNALLVASNIAAERRRSGRCE